MSTEDPAEGRAISPLQTNDAVLAKLVRESPIAIAVSTVADGLFLDVNESFLDLFDYSRDEVIGQTAVELNLWVDPSQRAELISIVAGRPVGDFEGTGRPRTGAERQIFPPF